MIGRHTVTIDPGVDLSCLVDSVTIHHGRDDTDSQPEANSATLDLSLDTSEDDLPAELEIGATLRITTTIDATTSTRFVGRVTDVSEGWADAGTETPDRLELQVMATGALAELGRRIVGDTPYIQQLDGARVAAIMTAAGLTLDPLFSDPGTVQILPRDVDSQPALDVAHGTAESAGGMVWSTRAGQIRYADADHRRGTDPALTLEACDVLVTPTWSRTTEALVNRVSIGYGIAPEGGEQPRFVSQRDDSITRFGRFEFTTTTELAAAADAAAMGNNLLTRNHEPSWDLSDLPVDVAGLDHDRTLALLSLDLHSLVTLTGLPAAGTAPTSTSLWVEGWSELLAWGRHEITLSISGYCRTAPPPRWNDIPSSTTWDSSGSRTWDDLTCIGPPVSEGRWDDVAASLRWDQIAPAQTWDTYTDAA